MTPKRIALTNDMKMKILDAVDKNSKKANGRKRKLGEIAVDYGIKPCTLSALVKARESIETRAYSGLSPDAKRFRKADKFPDIDEALLLWFKTCRNAAIPISDELLRSKAKSFLVSLYAGSVADISMSWIQRWKNRHKIVSKLMCGESADVSDDAILTWRNTIIPSLLQRFNPADIFNGDETGLFWKLTPVHTLAFVGEKCPGGKHSKERITVFIAGSLTGTGDNKDSFIIITM